MDVCVFVRALSIAILGTKVSEDVQFIETELKKIAISPIVTYGSISIPIVYYRYIIYITTTLYTG